MVNNTLIRILLVDDHAVVRSGLRRFMEREPDLEVCGEAADGHEGARLAAELKPDIVLLDVSMHGLNGLDTLHLITRTCPETGVIIFSMHENETLIRDLLLAGARGYVLKSDTPETVVDALRAVRAGRPFFSPSISETILETYLRLLKDGKPAAARNGVLTARERQILQGLAEGSSNKEMARSFGISIKTVETHRAAIMRKLDARSVVDVVRYAIRNNLSHP
jgi:DNA-binding NarL/FixJ family response regulator